MDPKITIDDWQVFDSATVLLLEGQTARIVITPEGPHDPLYITVKFENESGENEEERSYISLAGSGNTGAIRFINWDSPTGVITSKPVEFARADDGRPIAAMCHVKSIGKSHKAFLQFMMKTPTAPKDPT